MAQHYVPLCGVARVHLGTEKQTEPKKERRFKRLRRKVVDYAKHHSERLAGRRENLSE